MNKYIKSIKVQLLILLVFTMSVNSCSLFDVDVNANPNNPLESAPNLLLTGIQTSLLTNISNNESSASTFMGLIGTQGLSRYDLSNNSYSGYWTSMYSGPLKDIEGLINVSQSSPHYLGIAQTLKAIAYSYMVDWWGDLPYSEAGAGDASEKNINPKFDKDADIYAACLKLLDDAIANFAKGSPVTVTGDLMYNGNAASWARAARTFKLRMLMTGRKGIPGADAQIKSLLTAGNLIETEAQDFNFRYSKDPTSIRHPYYVGAYTGGEFTYINHQLLVEPLIDGDPRWPFQFRRQTSSILDSNDPTQFNTQPCSGGGSCTYGYVMNNQNVIAKLYTNKGLPYGDAEKRFLAGVFGRDRGDADGIPADGTLRTIPGVYPAGGYYDVATAARPAANAAPGGGIFPMLTGVNTAYYRIEAILELGHTGDARAEFDKAIRGHISRVVNFGVATDPNSVRPTTAAIDAFVKVWLDRYDAASSNSAKLNVVLMQLWYSSFGNGYEIFNAFRRTRLPSTIQLHIDGTVRGFPLRVPYPQNELTLNPNAKAYENVAFDKDPIFWIK
jgi:hypothetical protein